MTQKSDVEDVSQEEIEKLIEELADEGNSPSEIGLILRDRHGIPSVKREIGKKMREVLESIGKLPEIPGDLMNLLKKAVDLHEHLEQNPKDVKTKRSLEELESRIHKLTKYYKKRGRLPETWRYTPSKAELLVRE